MMMLLLFLLTLDHTAAATYGPVAAGSTGSRKLLHHHHHHDHQPRPHPQRTRTHTISPSSSSIPGCVAVSTSSRKLLHHHHDHSHRHRHRHPQRTRTHSISPSPSSISGCGCVEPLVATPIGSPCGCVYPMKVRLRLDVFVYVVFTVVNELAIEIATGTYLAHSQVVIAGAYADDENQGRTTIDVNLVPLGEKCDNFTAKLTSERFWPKKLSLYRTLFGDYEVGLRASYCTK